MSNRHKVFVSFHHEDQAYKDRFVRMMGSDIVDKSIEDGDIVGGLAIDTTRRRIRDDFIADATVTVVLIGKCTWQRKHVDWEIGSSLRETLKNPRCGLMGILLPTHPNYKTREYAPRLIPPRLADNSNGNDPYALIYRWTTDVPVIQNRIQVAFKRKDGMNPNNGRMQFGKNRSRPCSQGWQD